MRNSSLCWEIIQVEKVTEDPFEYAINDLANAHDLDFERIWLMMNRTSRKTMQILSLGKVPYKDMNLPTSTSYNS